MIAKRVTSICETVFFVRSIVLHNTALSFPQERTILLVDVEEQVGGAA